MVTTWLLEQTQLPTLDKIEADWIYDEADHSVKDLHDNGNPIIHIPYVTTMCWLLAGIRTILNGTVCGIVSA